MLAKIPLLIFNISRWAEHLEFALFAEWKIMTHLSFRSDVSVKISGLPGDNALVGWITDMVYGADGVARRAQAFGGTGRGHAVIEPASPPNMSHEEVIGALNRLLACVRHDHVRSLFMDAGITEDDNPFYAECTIAIEAPSFMMHGICKWLLGDENGSLRKMPKLLLDDNGSPVVYTAPENRLSVPVAASLQQTIDTTERIAASVSGVALATTTAISYMQCTPAMTIGRLFAILGDALPRYTEKSNLGPFVPPALAIMRAVRDESPLLWEILATLRSSHYADGWIEAANQKV